MLYLTGGAPPPSRMDTVRHPYRLEARHSQDLLPASHSDHAGSTQRDRARNVLLTLMDSLSTVQAHIQATA